MPIKGLSCMIPARQEKRVPSRKLRRWVWGDDSGEKTRYQYVSVRKSITYINIWGGAWKLLIFVVFCCSLPLTLHSADWTPEDLSYHRLNAYSLCCLCLFVSLFFCPHCLSHYLLACLPLGFLDLVALQAPMAKTLPGPLTQATWWCYIACVAALATIILIWWFVLNLNGFHFPFPIAWKSDE